MTTDSKFDLSRLREIGWNLWDPIGLKGQADVDDEYDRYLLRAADRIWHGEDVYKITQYLVGIEATAMGLGESAEGPGRAKKTAQALAEYVETLRR